MEQYIHVLGKICAPFAKVCSIVQAKFDLYGTEFMSKSMTFSWNWLGTAAYHRTKLENYQRAFEALAHYVDEGKLVPNLNKRLKLNVAGLKEAHRLIESATTVGKIALGVDEPGEALHFPEKGLLPITNFHWWQRYVWVDWYLWDSVKMYSIRLYSVYMLLDKNSRVIWWTTNKSVIDHTTTLYFSVCPISSTKKLPFPQNQFIQIVGNIGAEVASYWYSSRITWYRSGRHHEASTNCLPSMYSTRNEDTLGFLFLCLLLYPYGYILFVLMSRCAVRTNVVVVRRILLRLHRLAFEGLSHWLHPLLVGVPGNYILFTTASQMAAWKGQRAQLDSI